MTEDPAGPGVPGPQGGGRGGARPGAARSKLGRGLSALFEDEPDRDPAGGGADSGAGAGGGAAMLPVAFLSPGPFQPRRAFDGDAHTELVASIRQRGVLQPLLVRPDPGDPDRYQIVAGERRWRAAQAAGLHEVPAVVRTLGDREALEAALVENIQRENLTPLEEAEGYRRLTDDFDRTQEELARVLGKSRSHITNTLRLLFLPEGVKALLQAGKLSAGHGRALMNAIDPLGIAAVAMRRNLTVRETERLIRREKQPARSAELAAPAAWAMGGTGDADGTDGAPGASDAAPPAAAGGAAPQDEWGAAPAKSPDIAAFERDLSLLLGLQVTITPHALDAGELTLRYTTLEQFDDILRRLGDGEF